MTVKVLVYSGAREGFTVPLGVTSLTIDATGGAGSPGVSDGVNGSFAKAIGGRAKGTFGVTPGTICYARVAKRGDPASTGYSNNQPLGGYPNGGNGSAGSVTGGNAKHSGGAGGGSSDFRIGNDAVGSQVIVAAGGGGRSYWDSNGVTLAANPAHDGGNATTSAGGAAGTGDLHNGYAGGRNAGGNAGNASTGSTAAGGGGGYYGGGGAGSQAAASHGGGTWGGASAVPEGDSGHGGNGSNFVAAAGTSVTNTAPSSVGDIAIVPSGPDGSITLTYSLPPAAPAPSQPFDYSNTDNSLPTTFAWTNPALPEPGDAITGYEIQYRRVGDTDWVSLGATTSTATTVDVAVGTFTGNSLIEWQVRSKGTLTTNFGPWSISYYFDAIAPPDPPTIVSPAAGATISSSPQTLAWNPVANQQAWQARRCSTLAGGTVYWDSGVNAAPASSVVVPFDTVTRTDHLQVRVQVNGLWSTWADETVSVAIVPPSTPTISATPSSASASVTVTVTNPAGGVAAVSNDIYRSDPQNAEVRVAAGIPVNGSWTDRTAAHKIVYSYRAVALAANGAGASS